MNGFAQRFNLPLAAPVILLAALVFSYRENISGLVAQWLNNDDFSHGLLILPISVWLTWERRRRLVPLPRGVDWHAFWLLGAALGLYVVGELGAELFTTRVALLLFVIGIVWLLNGWRWIKELRFPLLFLFLMLPLPGFIYRNLTFPLQILSSKMAVAFLHLWGIMAFREGNIIDMGFAQFQVAEACNGLRFILPLFTLGVLFAFHKPKLLLKRLVLVSATIPIAITANIIRIGGTGILAKYWGTEVAEGFFHGFSGWAVFMLSFAAFFLLNQLLKLMPGKAAETGNTPETSSIPETVSAPKTALLPPMLVALALILTTPLVVGWLGRVPPRPLKQPLDQFPLVFQGREGKPQEMEADMWERVGGQSYFMADYRRDGAMPLNFYVAYYECQRKAGDFIHSPRLCLPGAGWFIDINHTRELETQRSGRAGNLAFNELLIRKRDHSQLVYFWYQGRDRNFTNEFSAKFWMVWDGIWHRRTDGALVRLIYPLSGGACLEEGRKEMDRFALAVYHELNRFLP